MSNLPVNAVTPANDVTRLFSSPEKSILITDAEPDDFFAMMLLNIFKHYFRYTVITESRKEIVPLKTFYMKSSFPNSEYLLGDFSEKKYKFTLDRQLTEEEKNIVDQYVNNTEEVINKTQEKLINFIQNNDEVFIVSICPPRNLFRIWKNPVTRSLLKKVTVWSYGSFNYRTIYSDKNITEEDKKDFFEFLNTGFRRLYTYETFFALNINTIDINNTPLIYKWLYDNQSRPDIKLMLNLIKQWNNNIILEIINRTLKIFDSDKEWLPLSKYQSSYNFLKSVKEYLVQPDSDITKIVYTEQNTTDLQNLIDDMKKGHPDKSTVKLMEDVNREMKITKNIIVSPVIQIVCADVGLVLSMYEESMMNMYERVRISLTEIGYVVLNEPDNESTHYYFRPNEELKAKMLSHYDQLMLKIVS